MHPTQLELLDGKRLRIQWSSGEQREYSAHELRENCPCATCREKRQNKSNESASLLPVLSPEETLPLTISAMNPMGNYAYNIEFSDGHNTGIYSIEFLHSLGNTID
tara:strand:- start:2494 stop:2811 length:318 start_codon:yes stop_codon:yes gene_type:complete